MSINKNNSDSTDYLPFSRPTISQETIDEVVSCLKSGWITTGPRVTKLEDMLKEYLHVPHALALTSATAGLHLALLSLNLKPGDEVIVPAMTFVASYNTIVQAGARPVLVDVDPKTFNIDVNKIQDAITPRTRAIMPVHFAGLAVDLNSIYQMAEKYKLRVVEDAAQAIGTRYKNKLIGSFGDIQVFSFHPNKNMTTGEGGAVITRDDDTAKFIKAMRFHGIDREAFNRFSKEGSQHYDVIGAGFKYNMLDLQAAIGIHQLPSLESFNMRRYDLAKRYNNLLAEWPQWQLPVAADDEEAAGHAWHIYTPLINPASAGMTRDEFMARMKEHNIGIGLHYTAPYLYSYYQEKFGYRSGDFPVAEDIGNRIVSLPLFPLMTDAEQDRVIAAMRKIFKN